METASAQLNTYRQSPRKVRIVADVIRGKTITQALASLKILNKVATKPLKKLLDSAVVNAKNKGLKADTLFVKDISVNNGQIFYRRLPMSRGRAFSKRKRTSHIKIVLGEMQNPKGKIQNLNSRLKNNENVKT